MPIDMKKMEEAFAKEAEPIRKRIETIITKELKSCPDCKETDVKFIMCKKHRDELTELNKQISEIQFGYQLKMELHKDEIMKLREEALRAILEAQKKAGKSVKLPACATCPSHA